MKILNSFNAELNLKIDNQNYRYFDLKHVADQFNLDLTKVPIYIKIIMENLLRNEDGSSINKSMISSFISFIKEKTEESLEIAFFQQGY